MKRIASLLILLTSAVVLAIPGAAQQQENHQATTSPLVQLLQSKGVLTAGEAAQLSQASSPDEMNQRLAQLLVERGLITQEDYNQTVGTAVAVSVSEHNPTSAHLMNAVLRGPSSTTSLAVATNAPSPPQAATTPTGPAVVPAVTPLRVLPIDVPKQGGLIPDIKLGSGASMKLYGFFKASAIEDTASSGGATFGSQDWPLPLLIGGDTGPTRDPQFHIKARSFRVGSQFEWVPKGSNVTVTGKLEADYEGDYTNVNNRNISGVRSSQFGLRLAYMRLDTTLGGILPWFAEFGQDWTLVSSTLPSLFETTGLGVGMGTLYERLPMFRTGVQFHAGDFKIQPEFAIVLPTAGSPGLTDEQRARFGDRAGSESNQPGLEARVVLQFPLSHSWTGVAPAQLIVGGHHARMNEIIPGVAQAATSQTCLATPCTIKTPFPGNPSVPNLGFTTTTTILGATNCANPLGCDLAAFFPRGTEADNPQNIWTTEVQLPTPWFTFVAKFYKGNDMRFFFGGQLNDVFSNLQGLTEVGNGISFSGRPILFGCAGGTTVGQPADTINCQGNPVLSAKLQPIGGVGGFGELSFPLSRIFHANPEGHNAGWVLHVQYGTDRANAADVRHGNGLARTDLDTASLTYKLNKWVSFVNETSYIVTRAATANSKLFAGKKVTQAHDWRNEFGPIFTF
jgi:hypothetical protein